jgi:hypothetical protein
VFRWIPGKDLRARSALASGVVAAVCCTTIVAWFRPGILQSDSLGQLWMGRTGVYSDMHPVVMDWLMGAFDRIVPGPFLALVFQCGLFFAGLAIIVHLGFRNPAASLLIAGVGFWPPILVHLAVVQKDTQMAAALLWSVGFLALALVNRARWPLGFALPALLYAQACRYNGLFAVAPLLFFWSQLALPKAPRRPLTALALTAVILVGWAGALGFITSRLTHRKSLHIVQELFLSDLVGMSVREGVNLLPAYLRAERPDVDLSWIRFHFRPDTINELVFSPDAIPWDGTAEQRIELRRTWWQALLARPGVYAATRLDLFARLLGLRAGLLMPVFVHTEPFVYPMHLDTDDARYRRFMHWVFERSEDGPWFRTWAYSLLLVAEGLFLVRRTRPSLGLCLLLSAVLYLLSYLPASVSADFRYGWWVLVAALVMPAVVCMEWREQAVAQPLRDHQLLTRPAVSG